MMGVLDDEYTAYCLDEATWLWGTHVEGKIQEVTQPVRSGQEQAKHQTEEKRVKNELEMVFKQLGITKDEATEESPPSTGVPFSDKG